MNNDFFDALRLLVKEKGISMDALCDGIQKAIVTAAKRDYNNKDIVFCDIDPKEQTMRVYVRKTVVEEIMDPDTELLPEQAQKYSPNALPGDIVEINLDPKEVSRIAADKGKHLLRQGIREAENSNKSEKLQSRNQEIVSAKVQRVDPNTGNLTVEFDGIEETLLKTEQIPNETFREGELIKVYVVDVKDSNKNKLKVTISRTHPGLVKRLFETEVPEIFDGTVEIKAVSREAGSRTKMAVYSSAPDIDPVGACIGQRGARVSKIVDQLGGEKIDIIKYSESPEEFIASALAPADVIEVIVDDKGEKSCKVIVPDGQLSLAIGNKGQNVRLAAKLTGWKIDIKPESGTQEEQVLHFEL